MFETISWCLQVINNNNLNGIFYKTVEIIGAHKLINVKIV